MLQTSDYARALDPDDSLELMHRDSKDYGAGPVTTVPSADWPGFLAEATGRERAHTNNAGRIEHQPDGTRSTRASGQIGLNYGSSTEVHALLNL